MSEAYFTYATTAIEAAIIGIGLIGNVLSIIIFLRKTFRNNSISTYCISLSIVECFTFTQFISDLYNLAYNINLPDQSDSLCKFFYSVPAFLSGIQPWIMVAFALDKLLCMRANSMAFLKKKWVQWTVVAGITLFHMALYMYFPILIKLGEIFPGYFICDVSTIGFFNQIHIVIYLLETGFIPFIAMVITSIIIIRQLIKSRNAVMKNGVSKERKSRDTKFAISSLSFNILFICFKLPIAIFFTLYSFFSYFDVYFFKISTFIFFLNASLSFFVHLVTNSLFRRELLIFFGFAERNSGTLSNTISRINPTIRRNQKSSNL